MPYLSVFVSVPAWSGEYVVISWGPTVPLSETTPLITPLKQHLSTLYPSYPALFSFSTLYADLFISISDHACPPLKSILSILV